MTESENKPDISLDQAIEKTKGTSPGVNFSGLQTIAGDLFELKKDVAETKSQIIIINWIIGVFVVALLIAVFLMLGDYAQFATKAYNQFNETVSKQQIDSNSLQSIKADIEFLKQNIQLKK